MEFKEYNEQDNDWALDIKENPIHISQAESGAKGYFCMGCNKDMVAAKGFVNKHYFRHLAKNVAKNNTECVYASRVYREKLAYFYFLRAKQITVPAIYKYPPRGVEGVPYQLIEKQVIQAHKVERELTFYENEEGEISWGKNPQIENRFLLIRPDAVFFNKEGKPILFIEFVITHKPDTEKLNKLQRLGIDTVQIIIPKLPEAELEKSISQVSKIKWTYNEIESNTAYISVFNGNSEGILQIDEEQRKLFEESYKCRAAQINNLIRSINRSLASQSYGRIEQLFEQEIQRIEDATREHQSRLDEIRTGIETSIHSELESRRDEFDKRGGKFRERSSDLEKRYFKRKREIREEQADTVGEIKFRYPVGKSEEDIRREFEIEETRIDNEQNIIRREERDVEVNLREESRFAHNFEGENRKIEREFEEFENRERELFKKNRKGIQSKDEDYRKLKAEVENELRSEFEGRYQQVVDRINKRDVQSNDELSERIKSILDLRGLLDGATNMQTDLEKYRKGISIINEGTWKEWD